MVINEAISIARKPESIWQYWMNVSNDVHWRNGITKAVWTSEPPYGIGSTGEHTHKDMGVMNWEVTSFNDGSSFEFIHTVGGLKGSIAIFSVESENNGSRVNVQMRISGPLIMRIMMLLMAGIMRKGVREDLYKLKELMEKQDSDA
ncbi:MAG: SRPBCC family protein [Candidatus Bathyarchaeota archaeon]|nr:SRPBCC family protein [Candidatus Bathyarchaeota archaeon]